MVKFIASLLFVGLLASLVIWVVTGVTAFGIAGIVLLLLALLGGTVG